jgi:hypothetical protein
VSVLEVLFWFNSLRYGVFPQKAPQQILHHVPASSYATYHLYWGCHRGHPYLLISPAGEGLHPDGDNCETDPSSNKPVKAKTRRLEPHFSRL